MKRLFSLILSMIMITSCLFSCSNDENYKILEVSGYDSMSGANHLPEIDLTRKTLNEIKLKRNKEIRFGEKNYVAEYKETSKGYLFNDDYELYLQESEGVIMMFGINDTNDRIDQYTILDKNYLEKVTTTKKTREECFEIAKNYFSKYVEDPNEYILIDEKYREIPEIEALYKFEFVRMVDGFETSDRAYIGVTVYGDIYSHSFSSLEEMKGAIAPTLDKLQIINGKINEKLNGIYQDIEEKYTISSEIEKPIFMKLSDGKYALEYNINVELYPKDTSIKSFGETTQLIVYLD